MADETNKRLQERVDGRACDWLITQLSNDFFGGNATDEDKHNQINYTATKRSLN
jgi:hypothetical protein